MPALIGITCSWDNEEEKYSLSSAYADAVKVAGGIPVLLADYEKNEEMEGLLSFLDGLLLSGGKDVDPFYFGEEALTGCGEITPRRDAFEIVFTRRFLAAGLPVLGICRGAQLLNIAAGGGIYQDIAQLPGVLKHNQLAPAWAPTHNIKVESGTLMETIFQDRIIRVNSFHHQAIRDVAPGFIVSACSSDGIIEAIEGTAHGFALGVQFHPEEMWQKDALFLKLFNALVISSQK